MSRVRHLPGGVPRPDDTSIKKAGELMLPLFHYRLSHQASLPNNYDNCTGVA